MRTRKTKPPENGNGKEPVVPMHHIGKIISRLRFNDGDIILVKRGSELAKQDVLDSMSKMIGQIIRKAALLMVVDDFNDITTISETEMNKAGWYKIETVYKLLKRGYTMVPKGTTETKKIDDIVAEKGEEE